MRDAGSKVCRGPCGLARPAGAFHRHAGRPDGRRDVCRDCRAGRRPAAAQDSAELSARYEAYRREFFDRTRPWDDPQYRDARHEVERRVRTTGPFTAGAIRYGWDRHEGTITRSVTRSRAARAV